MTSTGRGLLALLVLGSCAPPPPAVGKAWPAYTLFRAPKAPFLGYSNAQLISMDGGIPWRTSDYETPAALSDGTWSLAVQPAFQGGDVAAYVVTDIWDTHPDPWVQPVYHLGRAGQLDESVFGVGVDSTFYSPFWRVYEADAAAVSTPLTTVADIVNDRLTLDKGPIWVCPLVPDTLTGFAANAADGGVPVRPFTFEPVAVPELGTGWADGAPTTYLNFGERQIADLYEEGADGTVEEDDLYLFAKSQPDGGRTPLLLPAVMSDAAGLHAYVRRVDVLLENEAVFVPADKPTLRSNVQKMLAGTQATVPDAGADIPADVAAKYTLRVASDASCFGDAAAFPQGCTWLDSEGALDALPPSRVLDSTVTLTATPVLLKGQRL